METPPASLARVSALISSALVLALLLVAERIGYPLFHTLAELFAIVVASCTFMVMWNGRRYIQDTYLLLVGTAFIFIAPVDLLHLVTYHGMSLVPGLTEEPSMQFWVIGRFIQASVFLVAPSFVARRIGLQRWMGVLGIVTASLVTSVVLGWFPHCIGLHGLTLFKRLAEVLIVLMSLAAWSRLRSRRKSFDAAVYQLIGASLMVGIVSEMAFMLYDSPFSPANLLGHFLRIISFYLLYRATVALALTQPYAVLFRELGASADALRRSEANLRRAKNYSDAMTVIDTQINSTLEFDQIIQRVMSSGAAAIGADSAAISVMHDGIWTVQHVFRLPDSLIGKPLTRDLGTHLYVADDAEAPLVIEDARASRLVADDFTAAYGIHSLVTVPMRQGDATIGMLTFHRKRPDSPFAQDDVAFADRLGHSLTLAIDNAHLYEMQRSVAETLQRAMLTVADGFPGVRIAHAYRSADQIALIGGDFIDALQLAHGRVALLLGDVSGKGLQAAAASQAVRTTLQAFALCSQDASSILAAANQVLCATLTDGTFATATVVILDPATGSLDIASAGHPDPYLCSSDGVRLLDAHRSAPLGLFDDMPFAGSAVRLAPGDTLLLYSDGLIDARRGVEFFGEQRVEQLLAPLRSGGPDAIVSGLISASDAFSGERHTDDVALLALCLTPATVSQTHGLTIS